MVLSEFDSELVGVAVFAENAKGDRDIHEYKSLLTVSDIDVKAQKVEAVSYTHLYKSFIMSRRMNI